MDLTQMLSSLKTSTPQTVDSLTRLFVPVSFRKGMVLTAGDNAFPRLYCIAKGLVRGYFFHNKEEYTCWILEAGFLGPFMYDEGNGASVEYIEFLAETEGWSLNLSKVELLAQSDPMMYRILLEIYEETIRKGKYRELLLRVQTADERFLYMKQHNEALMYKVNNQILASFLNIKLKYLYKIKKRQRNK